jgi:hypothetical protein
MFFLRLKYMIFYENHTFLFHFNKNVLSKYFIKLSAQISVHLSSHLANSFKSNTNLDSKMENQNKRNEISTS